MDFGKVANPDDVDLTLPADHPDTGDVIAEWAATRGATTTEVYVGCAKWGRPDWVGQFYPRGTKAAQFLSLYARNFNCVELNATYHRMPGVQQTRGWAEQTAEDFRFFPKVFQGITHWKRLREAEEMTEEFLHGASGFGKRLGTIFLQLPPNFPPKQFDALRSYLEYFPAADYSLTVEFRHPEWFGDRSVYDETFAMLRELGVGAVITDTAGRRDVLHQRLTTPEAFIRFVGNNLHPSDYTRLDDWAGRIAEWIDGGARRICFFMHHPDELHSPKLVNHFVNLLNERCGLSLTVPRLIERQSSLFD
ncbi:MAG: DUF72 domain-containing protein [Spirochaetales bacterium]|nr:DUF72 domain-containing protein [Spirochaetales bacterium]